MVAKIIFKPQNREILKKGKSDIWACIKYKMFPEIEGEFNRNDYKADDMIQIEGYEEENGNWEYESEFEYPYGTFSIEVKFTPKGQKKDEEGFDPKPLPDDEKDFCVVTYEPEPISMDELRNMHAAEEEENKKREQEARLAQKRLEEEKARLRYEQQQQIAKQEQNTAQLKVYFEAMNLGFHTGEEDFNASMSVLSIYHQELMDNFKFYSNLTENPNFTKEENAQICLQAFVHFMKLMDIARTKEEATLAAECMHEIDGVNTPFADTLNIQNGLNYAQFLEAILRIAYYKKEHSDQAGNPEGFKITLETMFADAELDLKKRMKSDPILT